MHTVPSFVHKATATHSVPLYPYDRQMRHKERLDSQRLFNPGASEKNESINSFETNL